MLFLCRSLLRADAERDDTGPGESDLALAARGSTGDIFQMNESYVSFQKSR